MTADPRRDAFRRIAAVLAQPAKNNVLEGFPQFLIQCLRKPGPGNMPVPDFEGMELWLEVCRELGADQKPARPDPPRPKVAWPGGS